jgi:uncharacterized LabA/DUF88 family protein
VKDNGSIAILWDIENVTPSSDSLFVNGLIDYANEIGQISVAIAYGDWTKRNISKTSQALSENSFEMIHVPKSRKNSSDISLSIHAVEIIYQYPHIQKFILVTGDADFRPLLIKLRKHGIVTTIICDAKSASEDLLVLADDYKDFRDLIPSSESSYESEKDDKINLSQDEAYALLKEAVAIMTRNNKITTLGAVKVRVKLLNDAFDESNYGFRTWKQFVLQASKKDIIKIEHTEHDIIMKLPQEKPESTLKSLPFLVRVVTQTLHDLSKEKPGDNWVPYSVIYDTSTMKKLDPKKFGYFKFKKTLEGCEKRNLLETDKVNKIWSARLTTFGKSFFK